MKVIDKRTEGNNDWHVGDVICFESYDQNIKDFENGTDYTSTLTSVSVGNGAIREIQDYALTTDNALAFSEVTEVPKQKILKNN